MYRLNIGSNYCIQPLKLFHPQPDADFQCNVRAKSPESGGGILLARLRALQWGPQENVGVIAGPQAG